MARNVLDAVPVGVETSVQIADREDLLRAGAPVVVGLVVDTAYDVFARPVRTEYGVLGRKVYRTSEFDEHTGLLNRRTIDGDVALRIDDTRYGYDPAGNVTRVSSTAGQGDAASTDTQCFGIDSLRRLTQAWTTKDPKDACNGAPSAGTVGGPDSYWHTYSYDDAGNRTKQVQHATGDTETVTSAYTTPGPGEARPHSLSSVTTAGGSDAGTESFAYDKAGNTTTRTGGSHDQALDWDPEGHLQKITENGKTTEYLYDSSGNRMQTKQADGSATAYLPAGNELTVTPAGAKEATRYYMHDGETVAVRNASGFSFLFGDHQATALIAVAFGVGQTVTRRKQLPFGGSRSSTGSADWPGDRGFLGGTSDPTGYTHLGAREYDPATGRFLSVDPLFLAADPTQHNGYQYGNNNPTTFADPTGEAYEECVSGQYHCSNGRTGGTGNVTKVEFGKNYEKQTRAVGGKVSKNYYTQQATGVKFTYAKGRGTTKYTTAGESAGEKLRRKREAEHKRYLAQLKKERDDAEKKYKELQREVTFSEAISAMALGNLKKVWNAYSSGNSVGRCLSVSIGVGAGGTGQACIVTTQRPDGKMDVGLSAGYGGEAPSVGFSAQYGMYGSNADDFEQLRGDGTGMNVSIGAGIAASVEHEKAINRVNGAVTPVLNSRGEPVSSTSLSIGVGAGFEAGVSSSYNNSILHLFTW